jgi:hypothetical protein
VPNNDAARIPIVDQTVPCGRRRKLKLGFPSVSDQIILEIRSAVVIHGLKEEPEVFRECYGVEVATLLRHSAQQLSALLLSFE